MKRKQLFLVGLASALVSIGVLAGTVGKPAYLKHHSSCEQSASKPVR